MECGEGGGLGAVRADDKGVHRAVFVARDDIGKGDAAAVA